MTTRLETADGGVATGALGGPEMGMSEREDGLKLYFRQEGNTRKCNELSDNGRKAYHAMNHVWLTAKGYAGHVTRASLARRGVPALQSMQLPASALSVLAHESEIGRRGHQSDGPRMRSAAWLAAHRDLLRLAADASVPILLEGETGTGKTLAARLVHAASPRAGGPFASILLSAVDDSLASSELFGHVAGAYTDARRARTGSFATAHGGTLFLDEIGKSSLAVQRKLLHAIEYGLVRPLGADREITVDTRIVAATSLPLETAVTNETFLADLNARLEVFRVTLPPLRNRRADIAPLAMHYIERHAGSARAATSSIDPELMRTLERAPWPNNLRQLNATVRRLLIEAEGAQTISFEHCRGPLEYLTTLKRDVDGPSLGQIEAAMIQANQNASEAARILKIDRTTLYRRRRRLRDRPSGA
jgi:DNA-binding NtrC family response regulator